MEVISSPGKWTPAEYRHMVRREYRLRLPDLAVVPILFLYGIIFGNLLWCLVVGILVYLVCVLVLFPNVQWKRRPDFAEARTIAIDEHGISIASNSVTRKEQWASCSGSKEGGAYYVLQLRNRKPSIIILKRFFEGPDELKLRALLRAHTEATLRVRGNDGSPSS